jgi:hypothetical protein
MIGPALLELFRAAASPVRNTRPLKYQPAQLVPSGHGPDEVEGRRRRPAGSSDLIEAFHAMQLTGRALRNNGHFAFES